MKCQKHIMIECGIYSWNLENINYDELKTVVNELEINSFYQYVSSSKINESEEFKTLVNYLKTININTYLLCGAPSYAYDGGMDKMKTIIDEVVKYNTENINKISGVVFDVEFYLDDKRYNDITKEECFKQYLENMSKTYEYSKQNGIQFITVIPYWIDTVFGYEELETIVSKTCDSFEVMNYYKSKQIEHMENEINLSKKHNKSVITISELQKEDGKSITESITFYNDGLYKCIENIENILEYYNYDKLGYAYHEYNSLIKLFFEY